MTQPSTGEQEPNYSVGAVHPTPTITATPEIDPIPTILKPPMSTNTPPLPPPVLTEPTTTTAKEDELRKSFNSIAPTPVERCVLEDFTPFAKCHLWKLMMSFYDRQGVESWAQGIVPHFITSNTFIAKRYSQLLKAYFQDMTRTKCTTPLDQTQPFYIVELGTGSGKFSYYFLKALAENQDILDFPMDNIRYIMTDFTQQNFNFWKTHPALQPFVERGIVDFAIFDATKDQELHLYNSGQVITPNSLKNPICIIANYLFDTLYHDLFQVDQGMLKEGLVSVGSKRGEEPDPLDPEIIKRLSNEFRYDPIDENYYGENNPHLNNILKWYHEYYEPTSSGATILVPIGALGAIERLGALANDRLVVLSGDKGNNNPDHFRGCSEPHIAVHGSFSVMVNYHAIGLYFASRGGYAMHSPQEEASLKVSLFSLHSSNNTHQVLLSMADLYGDQLDRVCEIRSRIFPYTRAVFQDEIVAFGPNEFFMIQKSIKEDAKNPSLKSVLALLKLSLWDPDVFYKFRDVLLDQTPTCPPKLRKDIKRGIPLVWKNYYALDKEKDVAFEIGRLYYGLHDYENALKFYLHSTQDMGKHHVTCHNMGLCYYSKRQLEDAARCFEEAHRLNPSYQKAATWLHRVQKELGLMPPSPTAASANGGITTFTTTDQQSSDDLLVQQIQLVMSDHEEETARPSLQHLSLSESPTSATRRRVPSSSSSLPLSPIGTTTTTTTTTTTSTTSTSNL